MRILALETSSRSASVALLDNEQLVGQSVLPSDVGTASGLAPAIAELFETADWEMSDIELIAVPIGPGSFTGLRVGVTTAKTLAYALGCEVLGVDTLEVIAAQSPPECEQVAAVIDAQRQQVFCGRFRRNDDGRWMAIEPPRIVDNSTWLDSLSKGDYVNGPGLSRLVSHLPEGVVVLAEDNWSPRAETVGRIAFVEHTAGRRDDFWKLTPRYYRKSAAEEKAEGTRRKVKGKG